MRYEITYFMAVGTSGSLSFVGSFDEIRTEATEAVQSGECQRVEVRDPQGVLRYHFPRVLQPASHPA
jgi:hypothetical protein